MTNEIAAQIQFEQSYGRRKYGGRQDNTALDDSRKVTIHENEWFTAMDRQLRSYAHSAPKDPRVAREYLIKLAGLAVSAVESLDRLARVTGIDPRFPGFYYPAGDGVPMSVRADRKTVTGRPITDDVILLKKYRSSNPGDLRRWWVERHVGLCDVVVCREKPDTDMKTVLDTMSVNDFQNEIRQGKYVPVEGPGTDVGGVEVAKFPNGSAVGKDNGPAEISSANEMILPGEWAEVVESAGGDADDVAALEKIGRDVEAVAPKPLLWKVGELFCTAANPAVDRRLWFVTSINEELKVACLPSPGAETADVTAMPVSEFEEGIRRGLFQFHSRINKIIEAESKVVPDGVNPDQEPLQMPVVEFRHVPRDKVPPAIPADVRVIWKPKSGDQQYRRWFKHEDEFGTVIIHEITADGAMIVHLEDQFDIDPSEWAVATAHSGVKS